MRILVRIWWELGLFNPINFIHFVYYYFKTGANLLLLARYSSFRSKNKVCLMDETESITYSDFCTESVKLQIVLSNEYNFGKGSKVAIISRNSITESQFLFAASATGSDLFLLNSEFSKEQVLNIHQHYHFDYILASHEFYQTIEFELKKYAPTVICNLEKLKFESSLIMNPLPKFKGRKSGAIVVLTGGTTGIPKIAARKPDIFTFLAPVYTLLKTVGVNKYETILTPLPIYHGYGLATLITSVLFGKKLILMNKYDTKTTMELITQNKVELAVFVPVMIKRLLRYSKDDFYKLNSVITGGASISNELVGEIINENRTKLFNLYGTSEAGFCLMATPADLKSNPATIGKPIAGVQVRIESIKTEGVGEILIKSNWTIKKNHWIRTGDLGFSDTEGNFFLKGRIDNMIISGGENVYPEDVERIILQNENIIDATVIGVPHTDYGQVLKAFVVTREDSKLNSEDLRNWLKNRIARFQMPSEFVFCKQLPYNNIGKLDKKKLMD